MGVSIDRLSTLPDSLLSTIVSTLPFKEAVRTSILSKSWLNICKLTTNIEFDELFFVRYDQPEEIVEAQRRAFFDFTTTWIDNHRETFIDKFSLRLTIPGISGEVIDRCTAFATKYCAKDLELNFNYPTWNNDNYYYDIYQASYELPLIAYGNTGLQYLKLFSCNFLETEVHNLHSLKEVSLGYMKVRVSAIKSLLSSCKMLESLSLLKCWNSDDFDLSEEYLGLKKLVIDRCHFKFNIFRVNAPNLKFFYFCGMLTLFVVDIRSLAMEEATLDFSVEYGCQGHGPFLCKLVANLYTARILIVCSYLLMVIPSGGRRQRMHRNMNVKHLIMKTALHENEFMGITFMLNSCPYLECITIEMGLEKHLMGFEPWFKFNPERFWIDNAKVYKCLRINLKKVEIKGFTGTTNELCVLSYFIIRGKVLKNIIINIRNDDVDGHHRKMASRREAAELLLMLPKASRNLEISICR